VRFWGDGRDAPPVFQVDGVSYLHVKVQTAFTSPPAYRRLHAEPCHRRLTVARRRRHCNYFNALPPRQEAGLLVAAATRENVSPSVVLELLRRVGGIIRDYCGVLSEEAVRKNCVLVYELLDEVSGPCCSRSYMPYAPICVERLAAEGITRHRSAMLPAQTDVP
jgi:hypothetical protein